MASKSLNNADQFRSKILQAVMEDVEIEITGFINVCLEVAEDCCESPIEVAFLASFLAINESAAPFKVQRFQIVVHLDAADDLDSISGKHQAFDAPAGQIRLFHYIQPQVQIGKYRVDFMAQSVLCQNYTDKARVIHSRKMIIECDGHDFHERTADQAERDKSRDRELVAKGFTVLRYTGREIWRDPTAAAIEVVELLRNDIIAIAKAGASHA